MWRRLTVGAIVLLALSVVGFIGSLVWLSFGGDYDKYGRIDIPGSATVTLPEGEVDVIYAVRLPNNGNGGALTVPRLSFDVEPPDGVTDPAVVEDIGGTITVNSDSHVRVWRMHVPQAGDYAITTDGDVGGYIEPQLTLGTGASAGSWPIVVSIAVFFVSLGLVLVGGLAGRSDRRGSVPAGTPTPTPTYASSPTYASAPAVVSPTTTTPEQEMARLAQLQQLTDLHASGTLSDEEYAAARGRLGG